MGNLTAVFLFLLLLQCTSLVSRFQTSVHDSLELVTRGIAFSSALYFVVAYNIAFFFMDGIVCFRMGSVGASNTKEAFEHLDEQCLNFFGKGKFVAGPSYLWMLAHHTGQKQKQAQMQ